MTQKTQMVLRTGVFFLGFRSEYSVSAQTEPKTKILLRFAQTETRPFKKLIFFVVFLVFEGSVQSNLILFLSLQETLLLFKEEVQTPKNKGDTEIRTTTFSLSLTIILKGDNKGLV
jgi:hypothetical protein